MAEVTLLIMSTILVLGVIAYGRAKKTGFDMLDAYFLMVMLYLGVYSMIDAVVNGAAGKDAMIVVLTFALIFTAMLITWGLYLMLPLSSRWVLRFDSLTEQWANVDHKTIAYLAAIFFAFNTYVFLEFGVLTYVGTEIELLNISVPSWIGPTKALVNAIGFGIYVCIVASILKGRIRVFSFFGVVLFALVIVLTLEGRRAFLELVVFAFILWSCCRRENVYSAKRVPHVVMMLVAFFVLSNIYQTYRGEVLSLQARLDGREVTSLMSAAGNLDATIENYRQRLAMWNFNYMITAEQVKSPTKIFFGAMGWQSLLNSLPAIVFDSKNVVDPDEMVAQLYGFPAFDHPDYPTNDFATFLADFGVLMLVFLPIMNVLVLWLVSCFHFIKNRTLFLLVSTLCLQYLIKVENSYDIFILLRNILFLSILWSIGTLLGRVCRGAVLTRNSV